MTTKDIAQIALDEVGLAELVATEDKGTRDGAYKGWETRRRGVSRERLASALNRILSENLVDIRLKDEKEKTEMLETARDFHSKYGSMQIQLPIGRKMFFAPSELAVKRYDGDLALAWAEYAIHAVTNDNADASGKHFRTYGREKVEKVNPRIKEVVEADQTIIDRGKAVYFKDVDDNHVARLVARPEHGDLRVDDFAEVTATYMRKKYAPSTTMPLARAIAEWTSREDSTNAAK